MIDEFKRAGVNPKDVWAAVVQSRRRLHWVRNEPRFGKQAVYLDDVDPGAGIPRLTVAELQRLAQHGVRIFAPPIPALLAVDEQRQAGAVAVRDDIKAAGLDIITSSFERADLRRGAAFGGSSGLRPEGSRGEEGQRHVPALDALAQDVGVIGVFSDWPATVSYYASCIGLD